VPNVRDYCHGPPNKRQTFIQNAHSKTSDNPREIGHFENLSGIPPHPTPGLRVFQVRSLGEKLPQIIAVNEAGARARRETDETLTLPKADRIERNAEKVCECGARDNVETELCVDQCQQLEQRLVASWRAACPAIIIGGCHCSLRACKTEGVVGALDGRRSVGRFLFHLRARSARADQRRVEGRLRCCLLVRLGPDLQLGPFRREGDDWHIVGRKDEPTSAHFNLQVKTRHEFQKRDRKFIGKNSGRSAISCAQKPPWQPAHGGSAITASGRFPLSGKMDCEDESCQGRLLRSCDRDPIRRRVSRRDAPIAPARGTRPG